MGKAKSNDGTCGYFHTVTVELGYHSAAHFLLSRYSGGCCVFLAHSSKWQHGGDCTPMELFTKHISLHCGMGKLFCSPLYGRYINNRARFCPLGFSPIVRKYVTFQRQTSPSTGHTSFIKRYKALLLQLNCFMFTALYGWVGYLVWILVVPRMRPCTHHRQIECGSVGGGDCSAAFLVYSSVRWRMQQLHSQMRLVAGRMYR